MLEALLGNQTAERVLFYIANYGEGHISGIAQTFDLPKSQLRKQLIRLENGGVLIGRFKKAEVYGGAESLKFRIDL